MRCCGSRPAGRKGPARMNSPPTAATSSTGAAEEGPKEVRLSRKRFRVGQPVVMLDEPSAHRYRGAISLHVSCVT